MKQSLFIILITTVLTACAAKQVLLDSELVAIEDNSEYRLDENVKISAKNTKTFVLKAKTRWKLVGQIEQGKVFHTKDQVVIVNSFNVYEADIVIQNEQIKGYYIPINKTFVPSRVTNIKLTKGNS